MARKSVMMSFFVAINKSRLKTAERRVHLPRRLVRE